MIVKTVGPEGKGKGTDAESGGSPANTLLLLELVLPGWFVVLIVEDCVVDVDVEKVSGLLNPPEAPATPVDGVDGAERVAVKPEVTIPDNAEVTGATDTGFAEDDEAAEVDVVA